MTVKAKFFAYFRDLFGGRERDIVLRADGTVADALAALCDTPGRRAELFSEAGLRAHIVVMVNGTPIGSLRDLATPLADGDTLAVFPLMGGG